MGKVMAALGEVIPKLNANPKAQEIIQVLPPLIALELDGEDAGLSLRVVDGALALSKAAPDAEIVISGDAAEFARVVTRERDITHAVAEGKVWVSQGKLSKMILLDRLLNLARKR